MSPTSRQPDIASRYNAPRFGVEEEFLVVDAGSRAPVPRAAEVVAGATSRLPGRVAGEITPLQVETRTEPCVGPTELAAQLAEARKVAGGCAWERGLRLVATGSAAVAGPVPPPITTGPRQDRGVDEIGRAHV